MSKDFKFWKFLGALILPFLAFLFLFLLSTFLHVLMHPSNCEIPMLDEQRVNYSLTIFIVLLLLQVFVSALFILKTRNWFMLVAFIISISVSVFIFNAAFTSRFTYNKRMSDLSNWNITYYRPRMAAYFIHHDIQIGRSYADIVKDLGQPVQTRIHGKFIYEVGHYWIYELYFENNKCVDQKMYCLGTGEKYSRDEYDKANL